MEKAICARLGCGKKFEKNVPWKIFCSKECKFVDWSIRKLNEKKKVVIIILIFVSLGFQTPSFASTPEYFNRVVDAIYKAEGGPKAKVPYGILSVKVSSKEEARKVCYNTVRNTWKRWEKAGCPGTYLSFLANRYCPINDPRDKNKLNKNWLGNVERLMR